MARSIRRCVHVCRLSDRSVTPPANSSGILRVSTALFMLKEKPTALLFVMCKELMTNSAQLRQLIDCR